MTAVRLSLAAIGVALSLTSPSVAGDDPFADFVVAYDPGPAPTLGFTNSAVALGSPERFTGEGTFPSVVSPFSPAFGMHEIVSISPGGSLTLRFDEPITDDPDNLFGIDLIVFNNVGFIDGAFPQAIVAGVFGDDGGIVEISDDGDRWIAIAGAAPDGLMPTAGYLDGGAYDGAPGILFSDFTRPVDPMLTAEHMIGRTLTDIRGAYFGSGGGAGIDMAPTGLASVAFVRISNPAAATENIEIDAVADAAPRRPGDVNLDGVVNVNDLLGVITTWGVRQPGSLPSDLDNDGVINVNDLLLVIINWGS